MTLDCSRTLADLHELRQRTGDDLGAQRVAWSDCWLEARRFMAEKLAELPVDVEVDEAGNQWATLVGESPSTLLISGHIDSVPNGGWLDGSLNLLAGVETLRRLSDLGKPPVSVALVDWADEEGARFGRSLFGSSAACGSLSIEEIEGLTDAEGVTFETALERCGLSLDRVLRAQNRLTNVAACVELHIEQGPVLEELDLPLGVVTGTFGVERHAVAFHGQSAHAGSTPMEQRRDAFCAAARLALEAREIAKRAHGVTTVGRVKVSPDIPTAIAGECRMTLDQRHKNREKLGHMLIEARSVSARIAMEEGVHQDWQRLWRIDPLAFDPQLISLAEEAVIEVVGRCHRLESGPLHDAAEVARTGIPTVMLFVQSLDGLSHCREEDTKAEHLELSVAALDRLVSKTIEHVSSLDVVAVSGG